MRFHYLKDPLYSFTYVLAQVVLRVLFRFRVKGRENVPCDGSLLIAPTHRSYVDPIFVGAAIPRRIFYMAKAEAFEVPLLGTLMRAYHAFPVHREMFDKRALRIALWLLERGEALVIFPEGKRNPNHELLRPKLGISYLALRTGAPVLPVAISGTEKVMPIGEAKLRFANVEVRIGKPILFGELISEKPEKKLVIEAANKIMFELSLLSGRPYKPITM